MAKQGRLLPARKQREEDSLLIRSAESLGRMIGNTPMLAIELRYRGQPRVIHAKAEGNPFFVEEVLRMLIDQGSLQKTGDAWQLSGEVDALEIPDTLQGVLAARIDRLPEEAKRTLQIASVIGRTFQVRVLEEVIQRQSRGGKA